MNWINPVLVTIGPISIHWYGLMYAFSFILGYLFLQYSSLGKQLPLKTEEKDNLAIYIIFGVLLGGRIGYVLFYNLLYYLQNPLKIISVWEGGMSFHGGLVGVVIALSIFCRKYKTKLLNIGDTIVLTIPIGIFFVRIGNFINAELYGKIAKNFCLYFPTDPKNCRYPSQLLESFLEGIVLFLILYLIAIRGRKNAQTTKKTLPTGTISVLFLILYGIFRIIAEFFREPDVQIGYLFGLFTEGQLLSFLMILGGIIVLSFTRKSKKKV